MKTKLTAAVGVFLFCAQAIPSFSEEAAVNYSKICAACHGKDRKGVPAMAKAYKVGLAAMDLTGPIREYSDADLIKTISEGKGKMPAHKAKLKPEEIAALVTYLKAAGVKAPDVAAPAAAPAQPAAKAVENADYKAKCASCHGKDGKGNPAMAKMFKVEPAALDLTAKAVQEKTDEDLAKLIAGGKGKMPAFKAKLSEVRVKELLKYLRSFTQQGKP